MKSRIIVGTTLLFAAVSLSVAHIAPARGDDGMNGKGVVRGDDHPVRISKKDKTPKIAPALAVPFRSIRDSGFSAATAIKLMNTGTETCEFQIDFYNGDENVSSCTLNGTLGPLLDDPIVNADTAWLCSRSVKPSNVWVLCAQTCDSDLNSHDGKAIISMDKKCAAAIAIDGQLVYTENADDTLIGVRQLSALVLGKKK